MINSSSSNLLPHELIHSPLPGTQDTVLLRYHKLVEARYDKENDPVVHFYKNTTFLEDIREFLKCDKLSDLGALKEIKRRAENSDNLKSIRDVSLIGFKSQGGVWSNFKMMFLEYDKQLCSVEIALRLETTVQDLLEVSEDNLNKFHIVIKTDVGRLQSVSTKEKT
jgi:hypothetical protein